ncbi:MAG: arginyltransferase [Armatimonadota bacterium]
MTILEIVSEPEPCAYLPDRTCVHRNRLVARLPAETYERLLEEGWRKFGPVVYRPECPECDACRPLRIPVDRFRPSRSQRRCLRANADLRVVFEKPIIDAERLALHNAYHRARERERGWPETERTEEEYERGFLLNPVPAIEVSAWLDERLLGIALLDVTPAIVSGVYHYHDSDRNERGLGTFLMLQAIAYAAGSGRPWAHFGYHVADCRSLAYKTNFQPCELLDSDGVWRPLEQRP